MKRVLRWRGDDSERYYDASTPELLEEAATKILRTLVDEGWVFDPGDLKVRWDEKLANSTENEILALPESLQEKFRDEVDRARRTRARELQFHDLEVQMYSDIMQVLSSKKLPVDERGRPLSAWDILLRRSGWEYEDYSLKTLEE